MRLLRFIAALTLACAAGFAQGWQREQVFYGGGTTSPEMPKGTCAPFPNTSTIICVREYGPDPYDLDLVQIRSTDGGEEWSAPSRITSDMGAEFDPFLAVDHVRGRLTLLYSRNADPGNDLIVRHLPCLTCEWSEPTVILADGGNHWDASLLVLEGGDLLALETVESREGAPDGAIRSIRSSDSGATWDTPVVIFEEPGSAETYPVALQKPDGCIHLMFRDRHHGGGVQIGQLWSSDGGRSWGGHSVFSYDARHPREFTFIGTQGDRNITVLAAIGGRIHHWQSMDGGNSWEGPFPTTDENPSVDGSFSVGCRGPVFTYSGRYWFIVKRYDWYPSCR